ncbi:hypothetical protein [Wolbachia endosymbiont (group A) of Pogonocherus hispidulus]|uniref:hypothetical protein n=1 Tax=Wolbachia endosymbiont (group A) of Pogonocherus hispidulus TaxID=3066136 RepID=UPI00333F2E32
MPNTRETVRALVSAFNVHNYARNTVETNFTLQSEGKKDYIVVSFEKSMDTYQCREYLDSIKRKIIREFYGIEESNDAEILDTAKLIFDVNSFPFYISDRDWSWDKQHGFKFVTPVDKGVIFNLKSHLASSLEKDIREDMQVSSTTVPFNKEKYLCHSKFDNKGLRKKFESMFLSRMKARYENVPKNPLKVEGNSVYIEDVFDDARFIDSVTRYKAWLTGMDLGVGNDVDHSVKSFKNMIIRSTYSVTKVMIDGFILAPPLGRKDASVLVPVILDDKGARLLTHEEALKLNYAFNNVVLDDVSDKVQAEISVNGSNVVYGIDFSNKEISHCVITKIIESSVINKDHELSIDHELHFRALSPAHSPVEVPNRYLNEAQSTQWGPPTRSPDGALEDSPRQGSEKLPLHNPVNLAGTSKGSWSSPQLNSIAVSQRTGKCVSAAQNVQASTSAWSQPIGFWSSPAPSAEPSLWQPSRPLSRKGANESGSAWTSQPIGFWSSPASSAGFSSWSQSGPSSWKGANPVGANPCLSQGTSENKKSESPKKHWSRAIPNEILSFLKRNNKERNSISSSRSTPAISVTKKPPLSERSASERKAKSNPPSKVTSPTHEGVPGGLKLQQCLTSGQSKELYKVLSPEMKKKLDSGSLPLGYEKLLYLLYVDKRELRLLLSEPKAKEQMCSVLPLPPEKMEQVQSSSPEEVLSLLHTFFSNQKISDNFLISSRVDSPNIKKHLQEEKEVFI